MSEEQDKFEKLLQEIDELKKEIKKLKNPEEEKVDILSKDKVIDILDKTENVIKGTFSILEGAIIGSIEGVKKSIENINENKNDKKEE